MVRVIEAAPWLGWAIVASLLNQRPLKASWAFNNALNLSAEYTCCTAGYAERVHSDNDLLACPQVSTIRCDGVSYLRSTMRFEPAQFNTHLTCRPNKTNERNKERLSVIPGWMASKFPR